MFCLIFTSTLLKQCFIQLSRNVSLTIFLFAIKAAWIQWRVIAIYLQIWYLFGLQQLMGKWEVQPTKC